MPTLKGIDVSKHNGAVDWAKVKESGIQFAMIRAGYGNVPSQVDPLFHQNMKGALDAGLHVGAYWFSYALSPQDAKEEAELFYSTVKPYLGRIAYPLCFDFEYDSASYMKKNGVTPSKELITEIAKTFLGCLAEWKCYPANYANPDYLKNWYIQEELADYDLWVAAWSSEKPDYDLGIWQHSNQGKVNGIEGRVDLNLSYKDYPTIMKEQGLNGFAPEEPSASRPADVFYCVKAGRKWYPEVKNLSDFAGVAGKAITDVAIRVNKGSVKYRVHVKGKGWLPYVTGYNLKDAVNGYAGNGKEIDAIEVYYFTPGGIRPMKKAKYRVSPVRGSYWPWQYDNETGRGQDGYAGVFGRSIDRVQITLE